MSDNGRRGVSGTAAVFTLRWPFKTAPCFHWRADVRAVKDSSLSSPNSESDGPGRECCWRSRTFTPLETTTRALGHSPWIKKRKLLRWLGTRKSSSATSSTLTAAAAAANGPSTAQRLPVRLDARPLLTRNMPQSSRLSPGFTRKVSVF